MGFIKRNIGVIAGGIIFLVLLAAKIVLNMNPEIVVNEEAEILLEVAIESSNQAENKFSIIKEEDGTVLEVSSGTKKTPEPEIKEEPGKMPGPEKTPEPEMTPEPEKTPEPETTPEPEKTSEPETTPEPEKILEPETTTEPEKTPKPEIISKPIELPSASEKPSDQQELPSSDVIMPNENRCDLGHTYEKSVWESATCLKSGYYNNVCQVCGLVEMVTENPLPHDVEEVVVSEGNCMEDRVVRHICKSCGQQVGTDERISVSEHEWSKETVDGNEVCVCKWCGVVE